MAEADELRRAHVLADGVNRADARLRSFGTRIGDAVMCPRCDGGGWVVGRGLCSTAPLNPYAAKELVTQPVKCGYCNGEGLDPNALPGSE